MLAVTPSAHAQDASKILKAMSDYVAGQKTISMTFDADIEVITSELQKIQFTSSGKVLLSRPDKLAGHAHRRLCRCGVGVRRQDRHSVRQEQ